MVEHYADSLMRFVVFTIKERDESQDIVQESFARLWEQRRKIEEPTAKSYLFTIAYNLSISFHRTKSNRQNCTLDAVSLVARDEGYSDTNEIVWREIENLPIEEKTIIMLRDWEGYSYSEIEGIMKLSPSSVKVKIHRIREKLKIKLQELR